ncbi:MAG: polyribonucleotide nucleotidyltransferase [Ruminococcaceae bacterium]|nr:polyribonucleotide nucleotidyltransferase [Oscillospiraceae bacterium]
MFENERIFSTEIAGRPFTVSIGKFAGLANGSCMVKYGDTSVLCTATMSPKPREGVDYLPLSVDFEEKLYSVGRIPGSFLRRESRPTEKAILAARVVDRPMRPLFPDGMRNDIAVVMTVMSVEQDNEPQIAGMIGASIAVAISDIPWNGPIAGVRAGIVDGEIVINPTLEQREKSDLNLTVAATREKVVMIEAGANEVDNDTMYDAILKSHEVIKEIISFIDEIVSEVGKEKIVVENPTVVPELYAAIEERVIDRLRVAMDTDDKTVRDAALIPIYDDMHAEFDEQYPDDIWMIDEALYQLQKFVVRRWLLDDKKRVDGRGIDDIRPLHAEVGVLPRVHGSGLFARGQTQVLTIATLAMASEAQLLDGIDLEEKKNYMHHYNFPSYSTGETRPSRGPGRREIGHGALAETSLVPVLPSIDEFPYTIRLVSEVLSSNGSTSQGSVCASSLALMDAGVPIKAPVAGISCGLVTEGDSWMTMVDIQGIEDFFGDMDFKVAGTEKGITSIQLDIKTDGISNDVIREALDKCYKARMTILETVMLPVIDKPREQLSPYAPKMKTLMIDVDKISAVIGKGGKTIQSIVAECDVKVDVEDDGRVFVSGLDIENVERAVNIIDTIVNDPEPGSMYYGKVTRILPIGAFVEIAPGKEGMVHISKLEEHRVEKVEDVVNVGDIVPVMVLELDDRGRLNLSRKDAIKAIASAKEDKSE